MGNISDFVCKDLDNDQPIPTTPVVTQTKKMTRLESYYHCRKPKDTVTWLSPVKKTRLLTTWKRNTKVKRYIESNTHTHKI